jgi:restriction endonuclease
VEEKPEITFEQQVARIHKLLESEGAVVTWDDHIVDPADQALRQIDISVTQDNILTIIECRMHSRRQNKTWIEQVAGKKIGLGADRAIAVSSSGFSKGALQKAKQLGVIAKVLETLTEKEISSWPYLTDVFIEYIEYRRLKLRFYLPKNVLLKIQSDKISSIEDIFSEADAFISDISSQIFRNAEENTNKDTWLTGKTKLEINKHKIPWNKPIIGEIFFRAKTGKLLLPLVIVQNYNSEIESVDTSASVEKSKENVIEIIKVGNKMSWRFDLSGISLPKNSVFIACSTDNKRPMSLRSLELRPPKNMININKLDVEFVGQ